MFTDEARNYVAGYIGHKLKIDERSQLKSNSWISIKGEGRLFEPSNKLIDVTEKCDTLFNKFHGSGIRMCRDPLGRIETLILESIHLSLPGSLSYFVRLNSILESDS